MAEELGLSVYHSVNDTYNLNRSIKYCPPVHVANRLTELCCGKNAFSFHIPSNIFFYLCIYLYSSVIWDRGLFSDYRMASNFHFLFAIKL